MCSLKGNTFKACSWKTFHYVAFSNSHSSPQSWWYTIMNLSHCNQVQLFLPWWLVFLFDSTRNSAETRLIVRKIDMLLPKLVWKIALKNTHQPKQWSSTKFVTFSRFGFHYFCKLLYNDETHLKQFIRMNKVINSARPLKQFLTSYILNICLKYWLAIYRFFSLTVWFEWVYGN